jgi:hypothetical protein
MLFALPLLLSLQVRTIDNFFCVYSHLVFVCTDTVGKRVSRLDLKT